MAQKVQVLLEDDIDGSEATETVGFALDGVAYEIDLNEGNAENLRAALAKFTGAARKVTGTRRRSRPAQSQSRPARAATADIRKWATEHDIKVNARGRIPAEVVDRYHAAASS